MKATAAVVHGKEQDFVVEEVEISSPRADEVLVRVVACGVCHTDLICRDQWYPVPLPSVFGHEGSGCCSDDSSSLERNYADRGDGTHLAWHSCGVIASRYTLIDL